MPKKLNKDEFIEKSKLLHDNKYQYGKVNYKNNKIKITITCLEHGDFDQLPMAHLKKQGCPKCYGNIKSNTKEFIEKSNKIHNNRYQYDKVNYINSNTKVIITCEKHGDYEQEPYNHLAGQGCLICSGKEKLTTKCFIEKSKLIHNDLYNYDKVVYVNNKKKVIITCKEHGDFIQMPYSHLNGNGCLKCAGKEKLTTELFARKSKLIHNDLYNYNKVEYNNTNSKIIIICEKHGEFKQTPHRHLSGQGCPLCKKSKGEIIIENILKENNIKYKSQYSFEDLKYKRKLLFDFGVLDINNNIKYLIEFNGEQHYVFDNHFHKTKNDFKKSKMKDNLKKEYCANNNIPIHIIKYNEDIDNKMKNIIS